MIHLFYKLKEFIKKWAGAHNSFLEDKTINGNRYGEY